MTLSFACGHTQREDESAPSGRCVVCGETRVRDVKDATPRFRGACSGPLVRT